MSAIRVELELKDGSFVSGMLRAGQSLDSFKSQLARLDPHFRKLQNTADGTIVSMNKLDDSSRTLLGTMRDASVVVGASVLAFQALTGSSNGLISSIIRVNAEMEKLKFQMMGMSEAADPVAEAAQQVDYLRETATKAPFSLKELTSTFVKLRAAGIDDTNKSMQALIDGIAVFGGSDEQLHRVTLGITQMAGKGVIQMEEMRQQLGESMPTAMRLMARSMGISVGELVDTIGTGKLEARSALEKFTEELNRAYGGSAIRMMQTFSGQVTQMQANLQRLATDENGELFGFFEDLKGYLQDFNEYLASPEAQAAANDFGMLLRGIAEGAVALIRVASNLSDEIKAVALAFAGLMVASRVQAGLQALNMSLMLTATNMRAAKTETLATAAAMQVGTGSAALAAGRGFLALGAGAAGAGASVAGLGASIAGVASGIMAFAPVIAVLAVGLSYAASQWDLLGNKTNEAYEELVKYGAESRKQAAEVLDAKEQEIRDQIADLNDPLGPNNTKQAKRAIELNQPEIQRLQRELEDLQKQREGFLAEGTNREVEILKRRIDREIALETAKASETYNKKQLALDDEYQLALTNAQRTGEDVSEITKKYQEDTLENQRSLLTNQIAVYKQTISDMENDLNQAKIVGDESKVQTFTKMLGFLNDELVRLSSEQSRLMQGGNFGYTLLSGGADDDPSKLIDKGQKELEKLREEISGLEADIGGASGEYAKLLFRIQRGDYGKLEEGGEAVQQLVEDLKEATLQKEALDRVMDGRNELSGDIDALREKIRADELALEARRSGRELNDAEKILERLRSGYYEGLGPIENIRKAILNVTSVTNTQGVVAEEAARVMSTQTFGQTMMNQINMIRDAIMGVTGALQGMTGAASGFSMGGGFGMPGSTNIRTNVDGGILDLIAQRESAGDYNATLDNGRWTGGPKNLTAMTLREIRALQESMKTPENRALYGDGKGSSALGRYQIVGQTLEGLIREMGLSGDELFDEQMQDEMARRLFARRGANPAALRMEWAGLNGVSDADIMAAIQRSTMGPAAFTPTTRTAAAMPSLGPGMNTGLYESTLAEQQAYTEQAEADLEALSAAIERMKSETADLDLNDAMETLKTDIADANKPLEEMGKNYQKIVDAIRAGKLGTDRSPEAARYKEILDLAKQLDDTEKRRSDRSAASKASEEQFKQLEQERAQLQIQIADAQARAANPDYQGTANDLADINAQFDEYLRNIELVSGKNSEAYQQALQYKQTYLSDVNALRQAEIVADLATERRDLEDSLLSERELRQTNLQRELALVDQRAEQLRAAGMQEVEITKIVEEQKAAIRAKYAQEGVAPIGKQMAEWANLQGNLEQASARWMDSTASGLAGLITGTGDLRGAINGIISDTANMGVRFLMSQMMPAGGKAGAGKAANAAGKMATGGKMPIPVKHTGGIAGVGGGSMRMASMAAFAGAKRYHTGGIIGGATTLRRNEVPIIAEKGEGVFTADQMKALGGLAGAGNNFQINAPVSVNGSSGTPEQNADLAKRISQEMENTMRMVVIDEMRKQIRPGNMMNTGSR